MTRRLAREFPHHAGEAGARLLPGLDRDTAATGRRTVNPAPWQAHLASLSAGGHKGHPNQRG